MSEEALKALLPFYVNGSLDAQERSDVEAWLAQSETARELEQEFRALQSAVIAAEDAQPDVTSDFAWAQFQRKLKQEAPVTGSVAQWWRAGAIAAALMLVVQTGYVTLNQSTSVGDVQLLSASSRYDTETYHVLQVKFSANATSLQIQTALQQMQAQIVSGPSKQGLYRLLVSREKVPSINAAWLKQMQSSPAVEHLQEEEVD